MSVTVYTLSPYNDSMTVTQASPPECTILFADLVGSTQLYDQVGDQSAFNLVDRCLKEIRTVAEGKGGRVVKHTGDGLISVFGEADDAADAAVGMHLALRDSPTASGTTMAVRVGFHTGPIIESGDDVFGDTVNMAARLVELASPGRALTTGETAHSMTPEWRNLLHALPPRILRGASRPIDIFELKCEAIGEITVVHDNRVAFGEEHELRLYLNEQALVLSEDTPLARLGRDPAADLRVGDDKASRRHAEIELRGDKFVLVDRSSNGTYIAVEGEKEFLLSREEVVLHGRGRIALGGSCDANPFVISFVCM